MSRPPSPTPEQRAEPRPERLGVAHLPEVAPDVGAAPGRFVAHKLIVGAARRKRLRDVLGGQHAGQHGVVAALDARDVDEAGRAADQRAARKGEPRHRLVAALGNRPRPVGQPLAALEGIADERMGLEALELLERRQIGIL